MRNRVFKTCARRKRGSKIFPTLINFHGFSFLLQGTLLQIYKDRDGLEFNLHKFYWGFKNRIISFNFWSTSSNRFELDMELEITVSSRASIFALESWISVLSFLNSFLTSSFIFSSCNSENKLFDNYRWTYPIQYEKSCPQSEAYLFVHFSWFRDTTFCFQVKIISSLVVQIHF